MNFILQNLFENSVKILTWKLESNAKDAEKEFNSLIDLVQNLPETRKIIAHQNRFTNLLLGNTVEAIENIKGIDEFWVGNHNLQYQNPNLTVKEKEITVFTKSGKTRYNEVTVGAKRIIINFGIEECKYEGLITNTGNLWIGRINWITFFKPKILSKKEISLFDVEERFKAGFISIKNEHLESINLIKNITAEDMPSFPLENVRSSLKYHM